MQPFDGGGRASTVSDEALDTRSVLSLDAHGSVDTEPTGAPCPRSRRRPKADVTPAASIRIRNP